MGVRHKATGGKHREIKMKQKLGNSPSSSTWVKFEDSDEVLEPTNGTLIARKNLEFSPSSIDVRDEQRDLLTRPNKVQSEDFGFFSFKRNSFPNRSRYSAL